MCVLRLCSRRSPADMNTGSHRQYAGRVCETRARTRSRTHAHAHASVCARTRKHGARSCLISTMLNNTATTIMVLPMAQATPPPLPFPFPFPTRLDTDIDTDTDTRTHAHPHAHMHPPAHPPAHARTHARTHACTHARTQTITHAHTNTNTHARTHTHAHAQNTQTNTRRRCSPVRPGPAAGRRSSPPHSLMSSSRARVSNPKPSQALVQLLGSVYSQLPPPAGGPRPLTV